MWKIVPYSIPCSVIVPLLEKNKLIQLRISILIESSEKIVCSLLHIIAGLLCSCLFNRVLVFPIQRQFPPPIPVVGQTIIVTEIRD